MQTGPTLQQLQSRLHHDEELLKRYSCDPFKKELLEKRIERTKKYIQELKIH